MLFVVNAIPVVMILADQSTSDLTKGIFSADTLALYKEATTSPYIIGDELITASNLVNSDGSYTNGHYINGDITASINKSSVRIEGATIFEIDDLSMTGDELKICLKTLLEMTKKIHPEEFI
jgi:hypothetical protein